VASRRSLLLLLTIGAWVATAGCPEDTPADKPPFDPHDETGEDDDTGDDDTTEPDAVLVSLALVPGSYVIDSTTAFELVVFGTWDDGSHAAVIPESFDAVDPAVIEISPLGVVTPLTEGSTTVTATLEGVVSPPATVTVVAPGAMTVRVVSAADGAPLAGAELFIGGSESPVATGLTAANGTAELIGAFSGPVTVTAKVTDHYRTSVVGATTRSLRLALVPKLLDEGGSIEGTASWWDKPEALQVPLGFVAASSRSNPVFFDFRTLVGPDRILDIYGYDLEMPSNVVIGEQAPAFTAPAPAGPAAVYAFTGVFDIADVQAAIEAAEDGSEVSALIETLAAHLRDVDYALVTGLTVPAGGTVDAGVLVPYASITHDVAVVVPQHPLGFSTDDTPVIFPVADLGAEGLALVGLGVGSGGTVVHQVADDSGPLAGLPVRYVAVVEVDGIGSGNPRSSVISDHVAPGGEVLFPEFLDLTVLDPPEALDYSWTYSGDGHADAYFVELHGGTATWHVWVPGGTAGFELQYVEPNIGLIHVDWHMTALALRDTTFAALTHDDDPGLDGAEDHVQAQSRARIHYQVDPP